MDSTNNYRDLVLDLFPQMMGDLDKGILNNDMEDFMRTSNDFLLALVCLNMCVKDNWLQELEEVVEEWQNDIDY